MPSETGESQIVHLIEAVHKLTTTAEQAASSLSKLEILCIDMLRKQEEDRIEAKERLKKYDAESEDFKVRQKRWDEVDEISREARRNPWTSPAEIANLLLMAAFLAMSIAVGILANR